MGVPAPQYVQEAYSDRRIEADEADVRHLKKKIAEFKKRLAKAERFAASSKRQKEKAMKAYAAYEKKKYGKASNPTTLSRGKWVKAQIMVTRFGQIKAKIPGGKR